MITDTISVITSDGRVILVNLVQLKYRHLTVLIAFQCCCQIGLKGVLKGFDQTINLILDDSFERVFTMDGVEQVKLGVFIIRGDNV